MKLYYHPVSTTCRPILLFAAEQALQLELQFVDLFAGQQLEPAFAAINPNRLVPVLDDGNFRLTECSAILKYLAEQLGSCTYPADPQRRARINERMDWLNTGLYRDLGYGLIYPQLMPHHRRADAGVQAGVVEWGRAKAHGWLSILDRDLIGPRHAYLCGNELSIADYFGAGILTLGDVVHLDYRAYPNVTRWLDGMKARAHWAPVHEAFETQFVAPLEDATFVGLDAPAAKVELRAAA